MTIQESSKSLGLSACVRSMVRSITGLDILASKLGSLSQSESMIDGQTSAQCQMQQL